MSSLPILTPYFLSPLQVLELKNKEVTEEKEDNRKVGEFAGVLDVNSIETRLPGAHR